jgi:hypothetical protein
MARMVLKRAIEMELLIEIGAETGAARLKHQ